MLFHRVAVPCQILLCSVLMGVFSETLPGAVRAERCFPCAAILTARLHFTHGGSSV